VRQWCHYSADVSLFDFIFSESRDVIVEIRYLLLHFLAFYKRALPAGALLIDYIYICTTPRV